MNLYISSSCSDKPDIFDAIENLARVGFTHIELSGGNDCDNYQKDALVHLQKRLGLHFLVHNYFPPPRENFVLNIATANEALRGNCLALVTEAIALTAEFGNRHYSVHAGFAHEMSTCCDPDGVFLSTSPIESPSSHQKLFLESVIELLPAGFHLAVENSFPRADSSVCSLMATPEEITIFLQKYLARPVGMLLDLGHLGVSAAILGFDKYAFLGHLVPQWKTRILEIHLSTNDGSRDVHAITAPDSPDVAFLQEHKRELAHAPVVLEWQKTDCREAYAAYSRLVPLIGQEQKQ